MQRGLAKLHTNQSLVWGVSNQGQSSKFVTDAKRRDSEFAVNLAVKIAANFAVEGAVNFAVEGAVNFAVNYTVNFQNPVFFSRWILPKHVNKIQSKKKRNSSKSKFTQNSHQNSRWILWAKTVIKKAVQNAIKNTKIHIKIHIKIHGDFFAAIPDT